MSETDKKEKVESASQEFSSVVDKTSEFLKAIFPHTYKFVSSVFGRKRKEDSKE